MNKIKQPRLKDVADAAGVSVMTASRALRGESVADATRQAVLVAAEKLGYEYRVRQGRPRGPAQKSRASVDVVVGTAVSPHGLFYSSLLVALERALERHGHDCVIRTCGSVYEEFVSLSNALRTTPAKGVLITGYFPAQQLAALLSCHARCLLVDHTGDPALTSEYESVAVDYEDAARQAVRHLLNLGRKRIALLTGPKDHYFSRDATQGYINALQQAGIEPDPTLLLRADFSSDGARQALRAAMADGTEFDAVFSNDEMALGVLRALHEEGRSAPGDVAVVGCDGLPVGACSIPSLTTLEVNVEGLAEEAVSRLMEVGPDNRVPCHIQVCARLRLRESA